MFIRILICIAFFISCSAYAKDSAIVVFDGSGSMKAKVEGKPKIAIAREVMGSLMQDWNEDIDLGLMVYGHRTKACDDIEMVVPVGQPDPSTLVNAINAIAPKGETPIGASLKQAAEQLNYIESPTTVILVSDGEESCNSDPCAVAKELEKDGINFTVHVIGFDVSGAKQAKAQAQLKCVAESTGGKFFEAKDSAGLKTALAETAKAVAQMPDGAGSHDSPIWMMPSEVYEGNDSNGSVYYKFRVPTDTSARFTFQVKETKPVFGVNTSSTIMADDSSKNFFVLKKGASPIARGNKVFNAEEHVFLPEKDYRYYIYRVSSSQNNISFKISYTLLDYKNNPYEATEDEVTPIPDTSYWVKRSKQAAGKSMDTASSLIEGEIVNGLTKGERFYKLNLFSGQSASVVIYAQSNDLNQIINISIVDAMGNKIGTWDPIIHDRRDWQRGIIKIPVTAKDSDYFLKIKQDKGIMPYEIFYVTDEKEIYKLAK